MSKGIVEAISDVFRPQAPLWACELTSRHVIAAAVNRQRSRIASKALSDLREGAVVASQTEANVRSPETVRTQIKETLGQAGFKGSEITVVIPDDTTRISFLTAEKFSKKLEEQQTFIRWKMKKTVPFDVDSAQVAFRVIGPQSGGHGMVMLVALSPRAIVQEYENLFDSMDLHAGTVLPSTLAALNLFAPPAGDSLFLKVAADCITTTVFQNQRIEFYRRVTGMSLYDAVYPTLMYYQDKLGGKALAHLFVCGDDSVSRAELEEVQEKLGLPAQRFEPKSVDDVYKPALGAAHLAAQGIL